MSFRIVNRPTNTEWDAILRQTPLAKIYHQYWYMDIVCPDWIYVKHTTDEVYAIIPFRTKFGFKYVFEPNFIQAFPLFGPSADKSHYIDFVRFLQKHFFHFRYNLYHSFDRFKPPQFNEKVNLEVDLTQPISLGSQHKRKLKLAESSSLVYLENTDFSHCLMLFKAFNQERLRLPKAYLTELEVLLSACVSMGVLKCFHAVLASDVIASICVLNYEQRSLLIFSGNSEQGYQTAAMYGLVQSALSAARELGSRVFDFEGSNNQGLARFYSGFGASQNLYLSTQSKFF